MKTSPPFERISADISLVILAIGFWLMGLSAILHRPVSGDGVKVSSTGSVIGGCASIATGGIFSVAALFHRRRPSSPTQCQRAALSAVASEVSEGVSPEHGVDL